MDMKKEEICSLLTLRMKRLWKSRAGAEKSCKNFFANYNCTIIDVAKVKIGDNSRLEKARRDRSHAKFFSYAKPVSRLQSGFLQ